MNNRLFFYNSNPANLKAILNNFSKATSDDAYENFGKVDVEFIMNLENDLFSNDNVDLEDSLKWGFIDILPLVHSAFVPLISQLLNTSEENIRKLARYEIKDLNLNNAGINSDSSVEGEGPYFIKEALKNIQTPEWLSELGISAQDLIVNRLPVPPVIFRPQIIAKGEQKTLGLFNLYLIKLFDLSEFILNNSALKVNSEDYYMLHRKVQKLFEKLIFLGENYGYKNVWELDNKFHDAFDINRRSQYFLEPETENEEPENEDDEIDKYLNVPIYCAVESDSEFWLQYSSRLVKLNWDTKTIIAEIEIPSNYFCLGYNERIDVFQFYAPKNLYINSPSDFINIDIKSEKWDRAINQDFDCIYLGNSYGEYDKTLIDYRKKEIIDLEELNGSISRFCISADNDFAWIEDENGNGGVYELKTGSCQYYTSELQKELYNYENLYSIPSLVDESKNELSEEWRDSQYLTVGAVALIDEKWALFDGQFFFLNGTPLFQVEMTVTSAAFSKNNKYLLLANENKVLKINLELAIEEKGSTKQMLLKEFQNISN